MEHELLKIKNDASSLIIAAEDEQELNQIKLDFLGKSGKLTQLVKEIKNVPEERRPEIGRLANEILASVEDLVETKLNELRGRKRAAVKKQILDITLPGKKPQAGHLHLITQAIEEISEIFEHIGFTRVRYPEVEWDWYAFGSLNFSENHPARDDWETFFIDAEPDPRMGPMILTPHTSSGQVREMERRKPPIKMLNIAKCYRRQSDISHTQMFHQFEGMAIGDGVSIADLKGTFDFFVHSYFGKNRKSRLRPFHFQFTEPSVEIDVSCGVCNGRGCRLCKGGWLELGGGGMIHPEVLRNGGVDPKKYSGFAFGWGVERVLMMKEGLELDDLRILYSNRLDFLEQF
ncbi:MAG: phenylalanine--tRNA ligase subunit alpha [Candidatus Levybacteria bacterium RIFCSPHIGHO2_02_FULL_40_18]|nr:MAG: phenylalanine--tRNA ligase subunit alpha [Candidatus Levybacteria bacterium RIFCSPHIGHO2_01_FULL_40_58]OGH26813.1 MAG: phenylalanine--tRNA ligase subunit alpha [Candidatus Levybacteria bacterium RIFCSPHIGHO2_02_FULL_40_18]OGH31748.1 MAG: phenylalanine--tRNA ligase subunit alpha [Candidatus Levybacteria bacterium RIFCSPHIGHO2_12_FULL_40_31]OGH40648.1 MAG: phenylalanine--tRNA ligase subunit alpha [Candidatus Levybacteria bacterium RIFCSPLOWO2_01_FULL_40_64]OGH48820.1 MAG: phenylalanine--t